MLRTPQLKLSDNSIELIKWIALSSMLVDHINKYLFSSIIHPMFNYGRLALPLFVFVIAHNMARAQLRAGAAKRTMARLFVFGLIATPPYMWLGHLIYGWYPLNVMFILLALVATIALLDSKHYIAATAVAIVGGALAEFWWIAIILGILIWIQSKKPSIIASLAIIISLFMLYFINRNFYAVLALPVVLIAQYISLPIPRLKWFFYIFYPAHLAILCLIYVPLAENGYLLFLLDYSANT